MAQEIFELADQLRELSEAKAALQAELKELNANIERTNDLLVAEMVTEELQNFNRNDRIFYLQTDLYVTPTEERKEVFFEALRQQGFGDLIKETVNAQTLKAFTKEQVRENDNELPDWLVGLVNTFSKDKVVMRRA